MIVECVGQAFTYRWPGGEIHLEPGKPINLPDERAQRLIEKAPGKIRVIQPNFEPGSTIAWLRADGSRQIGTIDFIHGDDAGTHWAFVSLENTWAAVNLKVARMADTCPAAR